MDDAERQRTLAYLYVRATVFGYDELMDMVIAYGADPNPDSSNQNAIALADESRNAVKVIETLVRHGTWIDSSLATNADDQRAESVEELLKRGVDANGYATGRPADCAIKTASERVAEMLLHLGFADADKRDQRGRTPLVILGSMRSRGRTDSKIRMAKSLFEYGADVHAVDLSGRGVVHWAMACLTEENRKLVAMFFHHGANPNHQDNRGRTPMRTLLSNKDRNVTPAVSDMLDLLLKHGADPFLADNNGATPAHMLRQEPLATRLLLTQEESGRQYIERNPDTFGVRLPVSDGRKSRKRRKLE